MGWGDPNDDSNYDRQHFTGYYLYKRCNHTLLNTGSNNKSWARPSIIFRLADFYLYYAEACNEVDPTNPNVIKYIDLVRERAGIPGYRELNDTGAKPVSLAITKHRPMLSAANVRLNSLPKANATSTYAVG